MALALAACGNGDTLLVTSGFTDEVIALDARDGAVVQRIRLDPRPGETDEPHGLAVAPDGKHWFATVSHGEPTVWKFERAGNRLVGRLNLGISGAGRIGLAPDGRTALVPDYYRDGGALASQVAIIRLHDLSLISTPTVCTAPHDAQVSPDGALAAITCTGSDEIVLLDPVTGAELGRFPVDSLPGPAGKPRFMPMNLVWAPPADRFYVTLHMENLVRAFDREGRIMGEAPTGIGPAQLALTPDGQLLVTANRRDGTVSVISTSPLETRRDIPLDVRHPHGVAIDPTGARAFITYEGDVQTRGGVVALDIATGHVVWQQEVGAYTVGVVYVQSEP